MGGAGGASNPEQLFGAGYAACFHSALKMVAGKQKVAFTDSAVTADVGIGPNDAGGFGLEITLFGRASAGSTRRRRSSWSRPRTRSARTRTPPVGTSR